jgi:hypothetical protein
MEKRPGINIAKIPAKGVAGLIFTLATLAIFSLVFLLAAGFCGAAFQWD